MMQMLRRESGKAGFDLQGKAAKQDKPNEPKALDPQQEPKPTPVIIPATHIDEQEPRAKE